MNFRIEQLQYAHLNAADGGLFSHGKADTSLVKKGLEPWMITILVLFGIFIFFFTAITGHMDFPGKWEAFVLSWTTFGIVVIGIWREVYTTKHQLNCKYCVYSRCNERGKDIRLFYCNRWVAKPFQFLGMSILTAYSILVTVLFILTRELWVQIVTLLILVFCWSFVLFGWISNLKFHYFTDPTPRAYSTPPNHPKACICGGTGTCPKCGGKGYYQVVNQNVLCAIIICPQEQGIVQPGIKYVGLYICILMLVGYIIGFSLIL
jgi:hypothetical protein